jgi:tetratricopeptide (TPR) repeat protein
MRLLFIAVCSAALLAQAPDPAADGLKALDEGRYDAAVNIFKTAAAANPQDVSAHFNLALAYNLMGKDAEAIPEYRKVLELQPDVYEAHINLGQTLVRSKDAAGAIPHLKRAVEIKPTEFRANYYLGEAFFDDGQWAAAANAYKAAVTVDPKSAAAELGLARALVRLDQRVEAEPHYRNAATLDPEWKSFLLELATQYETHNELPRALNIYREFPDDPAVQERVGVLALGAGNAEEAAKSLETAVRLSPTAANRLALAQAYVKLKKMEQAEPLVAEAVRSEPKDFELRMFYARILRDQRKTAAAAQQFQVAAGMKPEAVEAWTELAGMLILAEQFPQALMALEKVKQLGAENLGVLFFRATTHDRLQQRKEALEYYGRFLETSKGANPDQEFQARQRMRMLEREMGKR